MAVNGNFLKLYNIIGNYRSFLSSRISLPMYRPVAGLKQSVEESIGLPPKPKKPMSPYFMFSRQLRPTIIQKNPKLKITEITRLLAQEWRKTGPDVREKLEKEYQADLKVYLKTKENYYQSFTEIQKAQLEEAKIEEKNLKEKKLHEKALKQLGKPKRPAAAIFLWIASLHGKRGTLKISEWQKTHLAKWQTLPEAEKRKFELQAAKAMEEYRVELKKWETKMIQLGNHDIIKYGVALNPVKSGKDNKRSVV